MKKIVLFLTFVILNTSLAFCATDKYSKEYLQNNKHISAANGLVEKIVAQQIKHSLNKEAKGKYKVKFAGYTVSSMKKGIFKYLEVYGENITFKDTPIPKVHIISQSDYNYVDYKKDPIEFKSDMTFSYETVLAEDTVNQILKSDGYKKVMEDIDKLAYPMFVVKNVRIRIVDNIIYIIMDYNFPIAPISKDRIFVMNADFTVKNGKIETKNVTLDSAYGKIPLNKLINLVNLLNPFEYTIELLNTKQCKANIENINIVDNAVAVNGKIFIKGD